MPWPCTVTSAMAPESGFASEALSSSEQWVLGLELPHSLEDSDLVPQSTWSLVHRTCACAASPLPAHHATVTPILYQHHCPRGSQQCPQGPLLLLMATSLLLEAAFLLGLTRPLPASAALSPHLPPPTLACFLTSLCFTMPSGAGRGPSEIPLNPLGSMALLGPQGPPQSSRPHPLLIPKHISLCSVFPHLRMRCGVSRMGASGFV